MNGSRLFPLCLGFTLVIACAANNCSDDRNLIESVKKFYIKEETKPDYALEGKIKKLAGFGNKWREWVLGMRELNENIQDTDTPLSTGTVNFNGRSLNSYGVRIFDSSRNEYVLVVGPANFGVQTLLLGLAPKTMTNDLYKYRGEFQLKCVIQGPNFSGFEEPESGLSSRQVFQTMINLFNNDKSTPGYNEYVHDYLGQAKGKALELRIRIREFMGIHETFNVTKNYLDEKEEIYVKGTGEKIPTYDLSMTNDQKEQLYLIPGPKDRDAFIIGIIETVALEDSTLVDVFVMRYVIFHPEWSSYIVKYSLERSTKFRNEVLSKFEENMRSPGLIYDLDVYRAIKERRANLAEWRRFFGIDDAPDAKKKEIERFKGKMLEEKKDVILQVQTEEEEDSLSQVYTPEEGNSSHAVKIPIFQMHVEAEESEAGRYGVAPGPAGVKPMILYGIYYDIDKRFTVLYCIVNPQWRSFDKSYVYDCDEQTGIGCLSISGLFRSKRKQN